MPDDVLYRKLYIIFCNIENFTLLYHIHFVFYIHEQECIPFILKAQLTFVIFSIHITFPQTKEKKNIKYIINF